MKKFLSVLTIPLTALAVLTGAIALPLLVRPFYWAQIQALDIPARSGLTVEQLRDAFGDVMDYCLGLRPDFAAGVLPFPRREPATLPTCGCCFCWISGCWRYPWRHCWPCTCCGGERGWPCAALEAVGRGSGLPVAWADCS